MSEDPTYLLLLRRRARRFPAGRAAPARPPGRDPARRGPASAAARLACSRSRPAIPGLMLGYWRRPTEMAPPSAANEFLTGDRASMDPDGAIAYLGRADDLMNAGGYRVSPAEVEAALFAHPGIAEAAAIAEPVRDGVSIIAAYYVPRAEPLPETGLPRTASPGSRATNVRLLRRARSAAAQRQR